MKCKIKNVAATKVIGMEYRGNNENNEIPKLWEVFMKKYTEIKTDTPQLMYGLCYDYEDTGIFTSLVGMSVNNITDIPSGMVLKEIPARDYAVFTFKDHISKIGEFWNAIYQDYLPENGLIPDFGMSFELYDERFAKTGECDIYIPINK